MKFKGICLLTDNVPNLADFYSKVFGVKREGDDIHSVINVGEEGIAIYNPKGLEQSTIECTQNVCEKCFTLMFEVHDVDEEYRRLKKLDIEFTQLPTTHSWGCRAISFKDPDGNNVDFFTVLTK